ncbi:MAG: hypothetical protein COB17_06445 [Sulfurimonas sp.]|nr:MAG: hypothetical protein COB17_06445 [Sulfurimonas sp.]
MENHVMINNRQAKVFYNISTSKEWTIEKSNHETLKVLDELIKFKVSSVKYDKGITLINPLSTIQLVGSLEVTRPSNHIGILRYELPSNTVFTFKYDGDKLPKYGIAKSEKSLKSINDFRERLLKHLSLKDAV